MELKDDEMARGTLHIRVWDETTGEVKHDVEIPNLITTAGKYWMAERFISAATAMSHMAVGTSSTAAGVGQTALVAETARVALSSSTRSGNVVTYSATFPAGTGTGALQEAGIFNNANAGTAYVAATHTNAMLNRATFGVITKGANDAMQINWTVTQG